MGCRGLVYFRVWGLKVGVWIVLLGLPTVCCFGGFSVAGLVWGFLIVVVEVVGMF